MGSGRERTGAGGGWRPCHTRWGRDEAAAAVATAAEAAHDFGIVFKHFSLAVFESSVPCTKDGIGR